MSLPPVVPRPVYAALSEFPAAPTFAAGHLVEGNATFRSARPVVDADLCSGCRLCDLGCPDGAIAIPDRVAVIDLVFCKGCGICVHECKLGAIRMADEGRDP